jgi:D-alanine-D-alanine ligase
VTERLSRMAVRAFELLGCRDCARFDFRVDRKGKAYFLECNPLPGLNPESGDIVILSRAVGLPYNSLVQRIVESALKRNNLLPR